MELFPTHIKQNGCLHEIEELLHLQTTGKASWEKEWLDFLKEWYAPEEWINVQTSGSTGTPKIIRLSKEFVADSAQRTLRFFNLKEGDSVLHCLPSRYIAGKLMVIRALLGRLDLHVTDPATDFSFLAEEQFQFAAMVPNQVAKILDSDTGKTKLQNIRQLLIGGSGLPQALESRLNGLTTRSYASYAMTETATHVAIRAVSTNNADEFYHCMEDIHVQLSGEGCLRIFVPGLPDGFLQTTDIAELKDEKTFRLLGRTDHIIISGGIKFSPELLEKKLEDSISGPFAISALPHAKLGQQLVLVIEGSEGQEKRLQIKAICHKKLDRYEIPRQILFTPGLPQTANGKLDRLAVTQWLNTFRQRTSG